MGRGALVFKGDSPKKKVEKEEAQQQKHQGTVLYM
jgi:hypothetical protein